MIMLKNQQRCDDSDNGSSNVRELAMSFQQYSDRIYSRRVSYNLKKSSNVHLLDYYSSQATLFTLSTPPFTSASPDLIPLCPLVPVPPSFIYVPLPTLHPS